MRTKITSDNNPFIKEIKSLNTKKGRDRSNKFIIEGVKMVKEVITSTLYCKNICQIVVKEERETAFQSLLDQTTCSIKILPERLFDDVAQTTTPQGIFAVLKKKVIPFRELLCQTSNGFYVLLDNINDPGNLGTIIRSANAFGVNGVLLTKGSTDPYSPKAIRATMGAIFRTPVIVLSESDEILLKGNKELDFWTAMLDGQPISNWHPNFNNNGVVLILGNEANGVSDIWVNISSSVTIPMNVQCESLNVGVAGSILMQRMSEKLISYN